jgi:multiple sugar transport system permease protein
LLADAGAASLMVRMVMPISLAGIFTAMTFAFTLTVHCLLAHLHLVGSPHDRQRWRAHQPDPGNVYYWGSLLAAALITSVPIAFVYNLFLDKFIAGFTVGAIR